MSENPVDSRGIKYVLLLTSSECEINVLGIEGDSSISVEDCLYGGASLGRGSDVISKDIRLGCNKAIVLLLPNLI